MPRAHYLDRIRVILTALVVFHHTAITYGAPGGWYYNEMKLTPTIAGLLMVLFVSVNQAYFMGLFFLLAGYFTPASFERKGVARFALDRLIRLGIPLAVFAIVLDPLTVAIANYRPIWPGFLRRMTTGNWHNGPLWFAEALLIFSLGYLVSKKSKKREAPVPSGSAWLAAALGVGAVALAIRQVAPVGRDVIGLQLGFFSSYVFLFAVGVAAWRGDWLNRLTWKIVRPWSILSIVLLPAMVVTAALAGAFAGKQVNVNGGLGLPAIVYAFWEPLVAWGIVGAYLVWFRDHANAPSRVWEFLGAQAYAVYIVHAPVLVSVSILLSAWVAPALVKVAVTGTLACVTSLAVASLLLALPGARRVL